MKNETIKKCPNCNEEVTERARFCANCGQAFENKKDIMRAVLRLIPVGLFMLFALFSFLCYLAPMIQLDTGHKLGDIYDFIEGGGYSYPLKVQIIAICYVVLSFISVGVGVLYVAVVIQYFKRRNMGKEMLCDVASWIALTLYCCFAMVSIALLVVVHEDLSYATSPFAIWMVVVSIVLVMLSGICKGLSYCSIQ